MTQRQIKLVQRSFKLVAPVPYFGLMRAVMLVIGLCLTSVPMRADAISLIGTITQDPADSGVTSTSNPTLLNVTDGDPYTVTLGFAGAITSPGTFNLTSILFSDPTQSASESAFISGSMTISQSAGVDTISVLGCLIDTSSCATGNELDLNFTILAAELNSTGVPAQAVPSITPLDLLEDGGNTDIHGSVTSYSYQSAGVPAVPEPSTLGLMTLGTAALATAAAYKRSLGRESK